MIAGDLSQWLGMAGDGWEWLGMAGNFKPYFHMILCECHDTPFLLIHFDLFSSSIIYIRTTYFNPLIFSRFSCVSSWLAFVASLQYYLRLCLTLTPFSVFTFSICLVVFLICSYRSSLYHVSHFSCYSYF